MIVYAFDRDQTVKTSKGPIPISLIEKLKEDNPVYAIGNQALCEEAGIPGIPGGDKIGKLRELKKRHPNAEGYVVVDDVRLRSRGWRYYSPQEFFREYSKKGGRVNE